MLRLFGWLFLVAGGLLCLTVLFLGFGIPMAVVGALLLIADALYTRNKLQRDAQYVPRDYRDDRGTLPMLDLPNPMYRPKELSIEEGKKPGKIVGSMFGR